MCFLRLVGPEEAQLTIEKTLATLVPPGWKSSVVTSSVVPQGHGKSMRFVNKVLLPLDSFKGLLPINVIQKNIHYSYLYTTKI